jgi:ceramide glucosyltransferase
VTAGLSSVAALAAIALATAHLVQIVSAYVCLRRLRRPQPRRDAGSVDPDVSILLPFSGADPQSWRTLGSCFALTYPSHELIFCAPSADEPAVAIVRALMAENGHVRARLLIGREHVSPNPKLDNLEKGWPEARSEIIVIADCNVLLPPDLIERLLAAWDHEAALVTAVPAGSDPQSLGALVECAFLNTYQARLQFAVDSVGAGFAHGKTMAFRRSFLDGLGGPGALAFTVAEDSAATLLVRKAGYRIRLIDRPLLQPLSRRSMREVWDRHTRWAQIRRRSFPALYPLEILSTSALPMAAAMVLARALDAPVMAAAAASLGAWIGVEVLLARLAGWPSGHAYAAACVLRDLMIAVIWPLALVRMTYIWRGNAVDLTEVVAKKNGVERPGDRDA